MDPKDFLVVLKKTLGIGINVINKSGLHKGVYPSTLIEVRDDGSIGLAHPMHRSSMMFMSGVELLIDLKIGAEMFEATVISKETSAKNSPNPVLWVALEGDIKRIQRRNFLRVPCSLGGACYDLGDGSTRDWFKISIKNVSLGGFAASVVGERDNEYFNKSGRYLLAADFGDIREGIVFLNSVLRNILNGENDIPVGAFSFEGMSVANERAIGAFVRMTELMNRPESEKKS